MCAVRGWGGRVLLHPRENEEGRRFPRAAHSLNVRRPPEEPQVAERARSRALRAPETGEECG